MSVKVSIIITCYNYARYVGEAIESALAQSYPAVEVVVVDDGSTDDTPVIVKRYKEQIISVRTENSGVVKARNLGFDYSTGDYICFLDADDKLHPDFVKKLVEPMQSDIGRYQLAYCDFALLGSGKDSLKTGKWNRYKLLYTNYLIPCAMMTRSSFLRAGKYSDYMAGKYGFEDWELWIKFVKYGFRGVYVPGGYFVYRLHGAGRNLEGEKRRDQQLALIRSHNKTLYGRIDVTLAILAQRLIGRIVFEWRRKR